MRIFLMGFMGSGKSTLGKQLAAQLSLPFADLDEYISEHEGQNIPAIFSAQGEAAFRLLEKKYLEELVQQTDNGVIALGGGTPCFHDNIELINRAGVSVYLETSAATLLDRLENTVEGRPLLAGQTGERLLEAITTKLQERQPYYSSAKIVFNTEKEGIDDLVRVIRGLS
jgi:shikimate kinase